MANQTKIIAELGNIHLHDAESCRIAIRDSINAGADLVKLQCINPLTAYWASKKQHDRYNQISWTVGTWVQFLRDVNKTHDNKVFVSTFDEIYVDSLKDVVSYWKVAFRMRDSKAMIAKMIWSDKPTFFSTNGKFYNQDYADYFSRAENFIPLYATNYQHDKLIGQKILQSFKTGKYGGISLNFGGRDSISVAKYLRQVCNYIEVHVQGENASGPDTEWSLTVKELERLRIEID